MQSTFASEGLQYSIGGETGELPTYTTHCKPQFTHYTQQWLPPCIQHMYIIHPHAFGCTLSPCFRRWLWPPQAWQHMPCSRSLLPGVLLPGNTRRAHRLMAWAAKEHGLAKQDALAEQLFEGYHCKVRGQGITFRYSPAMLLGC